MKHKFIYLNPKSMKRPNYKKNIVDEYSEHYLLYKLYMYYRFPIYMGYIHFFPSLFVLTIKTLYIKI